MEHEIGKVREVAFRVKVDEVVGESGRLGVKFENVSVNLLSSK